MKIEEYGINVNVTFHDIRKQGYNVPVNSTYLLNGFVDSISTLPLVRGNFIFKKHDYFEVSCIIGFKSGIYFSSIPKASIYRSTLARGLKPPEFRYIRPNGIPSTMYGAIGFTNKSEYVLFIKAVTDYVTGLDSLDKL